ncbi:FG-GAP-like repeat-containing protein [Pararhodospirillum oryzae]|uniref:SCP domain-containing protein n=1 Tax=Pararhodospirillum oryzae TaxID=478448 RepID=A0A512H9K1_9PROT|nr:FG-GAP-like repeat-containing protein [Pararhodospirillum oryzae]GEO82060.1 hypothetical protein ROR02_21910 [Pararhodospirillum oryzae]
MTTLSVNEQYLLEQINRARLMPEAEAARYGIGLSDGLSTPLVSTPRQALAPNETLTVAARLHSTDMLAAGYFSHTGLDGSTPADRMGAAGYAFTGTWTAGENISVRGNSNAGALTQVETLESHHSGLFRSPGHRENILNGDFREIGVGVAIGSYTFSSGNTLPSSMLTEAFAVSGSSVFVTGVVFNDLNGDAFYQPGEQVAGATVTFRDQQVTTGVSGGYSIAVSPGQGGTLTMTLPSGAVVRTYIDVADANRKVDVNALTGGLMVRDDGDYYGIDSQMTSWNNPTLHPRDFNGDQKADMLWFNQTTRQVAVWTMDGFSRTGAGAVQASLSSAWELADSGDYDGDGRTDLLFRGTSDQRLAVWTMNGLARESSAILNATLSATTTVVGSGDCDGDGRADLFVQDSASGTLSVIRMGEGLAAQTPVILQNGVLSQWTVAGVGDLNGDARTDLVWRNSQTGEIGVWLMNGTTRQSAGTIQQSVNLDWTLVGIGDVDGSGTSDLVWRHSDGRLAAWLMDGLTRTQAGVMNNGQAVSQAWSVADITDFDGNGTDDLLFRNTTGTGSVAVWTLAGLQRTGAAVVQDNVSTAWTLATSL